VAVMKGREFSVHLEADQMADPAAEGMEELDAFREIKDGKVTETGDRRGAVISPDDSDLWENWTPEGYLHGKELPFVIQFPCF